MTQTIKSLRAVALGIILALGLAAPLSLALSTTASAQIGQGLIDGAERTDPDADIPAEDAVDGLIVDVINIISIVVGVVAVIMIIIGGFKYITSGGDSGNVTGAKNTILYAVIGLVIVALAQIIVRFVLDRIIE